MDFEKAFDTVIHQRLLSYLAYYGVTGDVLRWIAGWLLNRTQCIVVDGESSQDEHVESGVPQGTVLGPLMFLIYINDIADNTTCETRLFADDRLLFRTIKSSADSASLQADIDSVAK